MIVHAYRVSQAAEVVQLVLDNGKMRPPEIIEQLSLHDPVKGKAIYEVGIYSL